MSNTTSLLLDGTIYLCRNEGIDSITDGTAAAPKRSMNMRVVVTMSVKKFEWYTKRLETFRQAYTKMNGADVG